jgi:hypothetical protein
MTDRRNVHVVDRLAELRAEIASLEAEAAELRQRIIESGDTIGAEHYAVVKVQSSSVLDRKALIGAMGIDAVRPYLRKRATTFMTVKRRKGEVQ